MVALTSPAHAPGGTEEAPILIPRAYRRDPTCCMTKATSSQPTPLLQPTPPGRLARQMPPPQHPRTAPHGSAASWPMSLHSWMAAWWRRWTASQRQRRAAASAGPDRRPATCGMPASRRRAAGGLHSLLLLISLAYKLGQSNAASEPSPGAGTRTSAVRSGCSARSVSSPACLVGE